MFEEGLASVMVAHLNVPSLEPRLNYPSSISYNVVTNVLKKELGFEGLIITDALNMRAVTKFSDPGQIDLQAFLAGNDILLFPENVPLALNVFKQAYHDSLFNDSRLALSVKKILKYKYYAGLNKYEPIEVKNLYKDLNSTKNDALKFQLYENAITVLKNSNTIVPIKDLANQKIAYLKMGDATNDTFVSTLKKYTEITEINDDNLENLKVKLNQFTTVIIGYHKSDIAWRDYNFSREELEKLAFLSNNNTNVILVVFASPYSLIPISSFDDIEGVIMSYQNSPIAQAVSAQLIFGAIEAKGKLPVSVTPAFAANSGLSTEKLNVLGFTAAENVGMNPLVLANIETIALKAIKGKMAPGMQILVARKGKVIYQKSFGYETYEKNRNVIDTDLYDIASLTKIVSTLPNIMLQYDQQKINLETRLDSMLPLFRNSNKKDIKLKELLSHYARLQPWIPFYKATIDEKGYPLDKYYKKNLDSLFSTKVADSLFLRNDYHDTIMKLIVDSELLPQKKYKYSDFTFIILKEYLEKVTGKKLDVLSADNFYKSLGANNTMYNPLQRIAKARIVPAEIDTCFRQQVLQGYIHDMGAAMEGGIGGHAGIFSNSMDVAKIMQLYLQKGNYGNRQYFSEKTFNDFNTCYFCAEGNRRGIGFDKPQLEVIGPTCGFTSMTSFGHTGFTGTMAWADPETEIVYIFLSNGVFSGDAPNKLSLEKIREDIQEIIYDAIER
jgi:CubicO group peptidase (beta-lactamase class C family)